jgi:hypothetical protein
MSLCFRRRLRNSTPCESDSYAPRQYGPLWYFELKFDGFIVVGYSSVDVAFLSLGITPVLVGNGIVGIDLNGLIVIGLRSVQIALFRRLVPVLL